jgi:hypothetical protein
MQSFSRDPAAWIPQGYNKRGLEGGFGVAEDKNFKRSTAEIIAELLSDERVRRGLEYVRGEEFRAERERIRQEAAARLKNVRERYRPKRRTPEMAARERELTLRLAEVEAEAAELRLRLSELLEEEEEIRAALEEL